MEKLRGAFGIGTDVNEGDAFNPEVQEAKRQAERDRREAEKQVCRMAISRCLCPHGEIARSSRTR